MSYICQDCGMVFGEGEAELKTVFSFTEARYEDVDCCPFCGSQNVSELEIELEVESLVS